jgi:hypothetical protein
VGNVNVLRKPSDSVRYLNMIDRMIRGKIRVRSKHRIIHSIAQVRRLESFRGINELIKRYSALFTLIKRFERKVVFPL